MRGKLSLDGIAPEIEDPRGNPPSGVETIEPTNQQRDRFEMVFKTFIAQIENGDTAIVANLISRRITLRINPKSKTQAKTFSPFEVLNYMENEFKKELQRTFSSPAYKDFFKKTYSEFIVKTRDELMQMRTSESLRPIAALEPAGSGLSALEPGQLVQGLAARVAHALGKPAPAIPVRKRS